ncbi:hypothetical protein CY34DRAFT_801127 [Suillus luteus UH-Slu-Lm8-n1]|uniref:Unplaced genomic scaffold CY34scaffold_36, whole genome shotgun sequence n=1 Tax=Suillus luteus UH-Slu-Lm8-n1 TaxID=930992 RepID=A0A0D0BIH9_9AGAM|nr:hypothetical protein CY34DRAFT_801127 [Suillus luteus UH-Slu-Lm8-n1]
MDMSHRLVIAHADCPRSKAPWRIDAKGLHVHTVLPLQARCHMYVCKENEKR